MLDFLRSEDPLSRTERNRVRQSSGIEIRPMTVSLDRIALRRLAALAQPAFATRREVQTARRCLSPREDRVIALLFDLGWQNREVAVELHINESLVSQIRQSALSKLRSHL